MVDKLANTIQTNTQEKVEVELEDVEENFDADIDKDPIVERITDRDLGLADSVSDG